MQNRTKVIPRADTIIKARIMAGLNKSDVAKAAGIPHSSIIRAERGQGVSPKTAVGISKALGIPFDDLFSIKAPGAVDPGRGPTSATHPAP